MARIARVVAAGIPFHVVQRGNRRLPVFLQEGDQTAYLSILKEQSDKHHLGLVGDALIAENDLLPKLIEDWSAFLNVPVSEEVKRMMRSHSSTGRPLGDEAFIQSLEEKVGRVLTPRKRGPKGPREQKKGKGQ